jgi:hypothetical protein
METGYAEAVATLVSFANGSTSLYFSNGAGMIGGGEHESVANASRLLVATAERYLEELIPTDTFPLPAVGKVRFAVLTFAGSLTAEADEVVLNTGTHCLSPLFFTGQEVLTRLRLIHEGMN